jgi:hypothetical protein
MSTIEVYHFIKLGRNADEVLTGRRLATLETIKQVGGEAIIETKHLVDSADVDAEGFLKQPVGLADPITD